MIVAFTNSPRPPGASTRATSATRASSPTSCSRDCSSGSRCIASPGRALPDGRELRRRGVAVTPRGATRASTGGCCCSPARSRSRDIGRRTAAGPLFDPVVALHERVPRASPRRSAERIFMSCGMYESLIYENRSLVPLLRQPPAWRYATSRSRDGHNWENWRDRLREGALVAVPGAAAGWSTNNTDACKGRSAWPTSPGKSDCRSAPTSAGRSASRRSCSGSNCAIPWQGDTRRLRRRARHDRAVRPAPAGPLRRRRSTASRTGTTPAASGSRRPSCMDDLYVFNNPWAVQSKEKHTTYCRDDAARACRSPRPG